MIYRIGLILFLTTNISAFLCLPWDFNIKISFDDFNITELQQQIFQLKSILQLSDCQLRIVVHYRERYFTAEVWKNSTLKWPIDDVSVTLTTVIQSDTSARSIDSIVIEDVLEISCATENWCDRRFLFDHIDWLLNLNHEDLASAMSSLLTHEHNETGYSIDDNNLRECLPDTCVVFYTFSNNETKTGCVTNMALETSLYIISHVKAVYNQNNSNPPSGSMLEKYSILLPEI